ncbi:MAG: hypothetical protein CMH59_25405, partial [Myxococcales bacterium]|nr:hypothetical protein [Myxococcales bacterium]
LALRHASLADSLLPAALVTGPHGLRLAYVLKKELLVDPCLDVVGHRIPNHFVDRAQPTEADLEAIGALLRDADTESGAILFPEGTRFSSKKRARVLRRLEEKGSPHLAAARALRHTLPPRLGGLAALLDANPRADVVFCAHVGLEGFATFADLLSGEVVGRTLAVRFWRVPARAIPEEREARLRWLYDQWAEVDRFVGARGDVSRASAGAPPSPSRRGAERAAS